MFKVKVSHDFKIPFCTFVIALNMPANSPILQLKAGWLRFCYRFRTELIQDSTKVDLHYDYNFQQLNRICKLFRQQATGKMQECCCLQGKSKNIANTIHWPALTVNNAPLNVKFGNHLDFIRRKGNCTKVQYNIN